MLKNILQRKITAGTEAKTLLSKTKNIYSRARNCVLNGKKIGFKLFFKNYNINKIVWLAITIKALYT